MQNNNFILPTAYLGPISYYQALYAATSPQGGIRGGLVEAWESFPKQTLRNRCRIAGANGVQILSIPVRKSESKQFTKDVQISYQAAWQHQHWHALRSAYEHTPFFAYYADYFRPFYEKKYTYLLDLNMELHNVVMSLLHNTVPTDNKLSPPRGSWRGLTDTWSGDKNLDRYFIGTTVPYHQIFADKHGFQENLSIVDLLFNLGTEALDYVQR